MTGAHDEFSMATVAGVGGSCPGSPLWRRTSIPGKKVALHRKEDTVSPEPGYPAPTILHYNGALAPICKVKQSKCPGILLESKPVSYSWFLFVGWDRKQLIRGIPIGLTDLPTWLPDKRHSQLVLRHALNRFISTLSKLQVEAHMPFHQAIFVSCAVTGCGQWSQWPCNISCHYTPFR
jgi:hypothetical protein